MKKFTRIAALLLAFLTVLSALPAMTVAYAEGTQTYGGTPISEHVGGYDYGFSKRTVVTRSYDFSMDRMN